MAETISLPDGTIYPILSDDGFLRLIRDKLGFEAGRYVEELMDKSDKAYHLADTDFKSYERQVEAQHNALSEIGDILKALESNTNVNKKVREALNKCYTIIDNHI